MNKKMPRKLVALSSTAIAAIYFTGYGLTHDAAARLESGDPTPAIVAPAPTSAAPSTSSAGIVIGPTATPPVRPSPAPTSAPTSPPSSAVTAAQYRDGIYQGTGSGRFGTVTVSVTVAGGTIDDVQLTRVATTYPASRIAGLPGQVVAQQSANVDRVTGATASTNAFKQAVQQALSQASTAVA